MLNSKRSDTRGRRVRRAMVLAVLAAGLAVPAIYGPEVVVRGQVRQAAEPAAPPRPGNPNDRNPGGLMDRAADSGSLVYVDDSFASVDKLRDAIRQASQGQSALALRTYQEIIDKFGQKLVYLSDNSYTSITDYVHEKQLQMPAVRDGMYDQLFGGDAKKAIDTAIENRDVATLIRVCDRYFPSTAAMKGLSQAADWYFERGEFAAAARTWQGLLVHPAAAKMRSELLFRSAAAESLAHNVENAKRLHDLLASESPDATGMISGKESKLLPKLDEVMAYPAWEGTVVSGDDWPAFGGGPGRSTLTNVNSTIGARLWGVGFSPEERPQPLSTNVNGILPRGALSGDTEGLPSHPVLANGALFIHLGDQVLSLSANAGTKLWSYPQQIIPRVDPQATAQLRAAYGVDVRTSAHDSVSVFGDQVFAMLPAPISNHTQQTNQYTGNTRVACLGRDDGHEIWSRTADEIPMDSKGNLMFVGSPMVTRQGVFIMARKAGDAAFSQLYLVRLDRETGNPTWSCYICSTSTGNMNYPYNLLASGAVAVPTLVDDILYVSTGQGADCAIDANVGRILWLRITESAATTLPPGMRSAPQMNMVASWKFNPPVVYGDKLITSDNGTSLRIYNRLTGQLLRKITSGDLDGMRIDVLAGMVGPHLILSGARNANGGGSNTVVRSINLDAILQAPGAGGGEGGGAGGGAGGVVAAPLTEWSTEVVASDAGLPQGRPFLTASMYYLPCAQKLVRVDLAKGRIADGWVWPNTEKNVPGKPGNILVTSEQVVVVNDAEVAGYSKWETALANRQARIEAAPKDPLPYLDLAEISFRTGHFPLAQETMKKSVDLANAMEAAGSASGAKPATEVLGRLYRTNLNFGEQLLVKRDPENRDAARFYYEQCKASSRDPEQQAEWRLRLSELALKQQHPDEAATLYNEVLTDPALRVAAYREGEALSRAGVTAANKFAALIKANGAGVYKRFEDQAAALLERSRGQKNLAGLQQVVDGYPNSDAAIAAGIQVAAGYREQKDWSKVTRSLRWVADHTNGEARARALADLASAYVAWDPKYYKAAIGYTYRGQSAAKDFSWTDAGKKMTFASFRQAISERGGIDIDGRLPALVPAGMDPVWPAQPALNDTNAMAKSSQLLAPLEQDTSLRPPNLLFMRRADNGQLRVYDSAAGADLKTSPFQLPQNQSTLLLGCYRDTAVLLQSNMAIGVNLKSKEQMWSQRIDAVAGGGPGRVVRQPQQGIIEGQQVIINGNVVNVINGPVMIVNGQLVQQGYQVAQANAGLDADAMRMAAFSQLDKPNFTTARIVNDKLVIVSGSQVDAYDIASGKPAWRDHNEARMSAKLPDGQATALLGNADVVVVQVESGEQGVPTFSVMDADTGKFRKQLTLKDERAMWRAVADDGTLFVVTDKAVAAYDLLSDTNLPLWRNTNLQTRYPGASALTLEGLIYVDSEANVNCLSLDGGDLLWRIPEEQAVRLPLNAAQGQIASLRSVVDGEAIVFQSNEDIAVFRTLSVGDQILWKGAKMPEAPPRQGLQMAEGSVVEFAMGPVSNARNAVRFLVRERRQGKLQATIPITKNNEVTEGPPIRVWQIVDGGLAFETNGNVQFLRLKGVEKNKPQGEAPH